MSSHFVAFWNLENLFAPEGFADREPWMARKLASDLKGWTQALFDKKINRQFHGSTEFILSAAEGLTMKLRRLLILCDLAHFILSGVEG